MSFFGNLFSKTDQEGEAIDGLTLYHFTTCPFCVRVRRAIKRLGLHIESRNIHRSREALDELVAGGGKKQVPCLRIASASGEGEQWLYESDEIVRYLEDRFNS